jgi:beta-galactosidase
VGGKSDCEVYTVKRVIQINAGKSETAWIDLNVQNPRLWDAENPDLYKVRAKVKSLGIYRTRFIPKEQTQTKIAPAEDTGWYIP